MDHILQIVWEGILFDFIKYMFAPIVMTSGFALILRIVFHKLETWKEALYFCGTCLTVLIVFFEASGLRNNQPNLAGGIQTIVSGGINEDKDTVSVITMNVINTGGMPSIVKNWGVTATINGRVYQGAFMVPAPKDFQFLNPTSGPNRPTAIIYHGDDEIIEKSMKPIQQGSMLNGTMFVLFKDLDQSIFKVGADYVISYEDVLSRKYSASIKSTAGAVILTPAPGIHSDLVCPIPKPKI